MSHVHSGLLEAVRTVISPLLDFKVAITPTTHLMSDLALDSLQVMSLVVGLEERFNIEIGFEQIAAIETVGDVLETLAVHSS